MRLARPPRAGGASAGSRSCSGLDSRAGSFRLREAAGGREGGGAGGFGGLALEEPAESLAEERVTLDDMRVCLLMVSILDGSQLDCGPCSGCGRSAAGEEGSEVGDAAR